LIQDHGAIRPVLSVRNAQEYDQAIERLNSLLDAIGDDEEHPLYSLLDTLGTLIHAYEEAHLPMPDCGGRDVLRFLMEEHGLTQSDLPELGSRRVVSAIVRGKRELNAREMRALAARFHVSPNVFL
jgi:HTH-type transcriptional regulator/antitoxin HigA